MKIPVLFFMSLFASTAMAEMVALDNQGMAEVTGQSGISMALEMRFNADASGASKCGTSIPLLECRVALSFNNRGTAGVNQEWLVLKGVSGRIYIPYVALDASTITYVADSGSSAGSSVTRPATMVSMNNSAPLSDGTIMRITNFTVASISVETDTASTKGYMAPSEAGFMGIKIDDSSSVATSNTNFIGVQLGGSVKIFPCNTDHPRC